MSESAQNMALAAPPVAPPSTPNDVSTNAKRNGYSDPKLRHEFVGMMFAVAVGEVGVQTAILVKASDFPNNLLYFLPAYSHLILASIAIAASWVGWTKSKSRGGQKDVQSIFEREFLILLLDVSLVVIYFILVRAVDFTGGEGSEKFQFEPSARPEAFWIFIIFCIYMVWDVVAKWPPTHNTKEDWLRSIPNLVCVLIALGIKYAVENVSAWHIVAADFALLSLILFFRAFKDLVSASLSNETDKKKAAIRNGAITGVGIVVGLIGSRAC